MSSYSSNRYSEYNFDYDDDDFRNQDRTANDSDEDTEDASETDTAKNEQYTEIKEQMYQDKLASLKNQLRQLEEGTHSEYNKKLKRLEAQYKERMRMNEIVRNIEMELLEQDYVREKKMAAVEYEEKKVELRENLLVELEERRKIIEQEGQSMELSGDSMEVKPVSTRKLRRRPNDPLPIPEKRRKLSPQTLNYLLEDKEVEADLQFINKGKYVQTKKPVTQTHHTPIHLGQETHLEARIEDGKLFYERKWYHRGQTIYVEGKDITKFGAIITAVGSEMIWVKKVSDNSKMRVYVSQLNKGKYSIRRRAV